MAADSNPLETKVQASIREAVNRSGTAILWRNVVGKRKIDGIWYKWGLAVGSSDLVGMYIGTGRMLCVEVKRPKGSVISDEQIAWERVINARGGVAIIARSPHEALVQIKAAAYFGTVEKAQAWLHGSQITLQGKSPMESTDTTRCLSLLS